MRITNTMMMNQTLRNVGKSKTNLSELENQMSSEKKITRPSDDPIVAIRALSLRSSLSEITQYLKNNIPDAQSWLDVTETSLDNMDKILSDIYQYCNQGSSDQFTLTDRSAVIEVMKQYKEGLYAEANTDYAGRYCFTGFKTDTSFTFQTSTEAARNYSITQTFSGKDLSVDNVMTNSVDITKVATIATGDQPKTTPVNTIRLAYSGCSDKADSFSTVNVDGTEYEVEAVSQQEYEALAADGTLSADTADKLYYVYDTGVIAIPDKLYTSFKDAENISFTYEKDGFDKTDIRPEMYFNCKDLTNNVDYTLDEGGQAISYTVNFNQSLQVNTLGSNALSYNTGRDIDALCNSIQQVADIEDKIKELEKMKSGSNYSTEEKTAIESMITAANKELDYAKENMEGLFSTEITKVSEYQRTVDLQLADLGARSKRLTLIKSRLTEQQTTFTDLKSKNEDADLEDTVILFSSAQTLYQAALTAASNCVQQSLLDYIR